MLNLDLHGGPWARRIGARVRLAALVLPLFAAPPLLAQETERLYLSGTGPEDQVRWDFEVSSGRRAGEAATIGVPSQWELEGFGTFSFGFHEEPTDEVGRYRHRFEVPAAWRGRRVVLTFEGVMTDAEVQLNGALAGPEHRGGFTPFSYDVSELLRYGEENLLEVRVREDSADASINRAERHADYWVFGGIYRPVYLEARPEVAIGHVGVDARHDGSLVVQVELEGFSGEGELTGRLWPFLPGPGVARQLPHGEPIRVPLRGEPRYLTLREQVAGARTWSAEDPNLYTLELELHLRGELRHRRELRFGFRTVEIRQGDGIYVNGRRVLLRGISRHSFSPYSGRALTPELNRLDAELIVGLNANAVRTSHYPPDRAFLEAADELGLYVIDELPGWHDAYSTEAGRPLVREMVRRDAHHPSILFWANGNEEGWNHDLDPDFHLHDPQKRPVLHPDSNLYGIDSVHYPSWHELRDRVELGPLASRLAAPFRPMPLLMPTELLHGLYDGGHGAGLEDYWNAIRLSPRGAGMFLWTFLDAGVLREDLGGVLDTHTNYDADGIVGPKREKEGSYFTVRSLWSPVQVTGASFGPEGSRIELENRFDHTDLAACRFRWHWLRFPGAGSGRRDATLWAGGEASGPAAPPGGTAALAVEAPPFPPTAAGAAPFAHGLDALRLTALDPRGREFRTWVLPVAEGASAPAAGGASEVVEAREEGGVLTLAAGSLALRIDLETGRLRGLEREGRAFSLADGPRPAHGAEARMVGHELRAEGGSQVFEARYEGGLDSLRWQLFPSGWLRVDYAYTLRGESELFGVGFSYPEEKVSTMLRLGRGPSRVWKNRLEGGRLGLWRQSPNEGMTGEVWEYPEWRGFFAGTRWADLETEEGRLTLVLEDIPYLGLYQPRFPEKPRGATTPVPHTDLSLLDGIPGIGSKFHSAAELGPAGRPYRDPGTRRGTLWLYLHPPAPAEPEFSPAP